MLGNFAYAYYAYNEETGEIGLYPVTDTFAHLDPLIVYLVIDGELVETTPEHPFYTSDSVWVDAGELEIGDEIRTNSWDVGVVEEMYTIARPQMMYNFTVEAAHTYFVGDGEWLVHNANRCLKVGNRSVRETAGNIDLIPGQSGVSKSQVEAVAKLMSEPNFSWDTVSRKNGLPDPIKIGIGNDGKRYVIEGHHRVLAAQLAGIEIPFHDSYLVREISVGSRWSTATTWESMRWDP